MQENEQGGKPDFPGFDAARPYESLQTPVWIFDIGQHRIWWGNRSAIGFWKAGSLDELLSRDFSSDSDMVRERLRLMVEHTAPGAFLSESWTLYPLDEPVTVLLNLTPVTVEGNRDAVVIQVISEIRLGDDPEALRQLEAMRHTPLIVSTATIDGHVMSGNPAAARTYGRAGIEEADGGEMSLASRFVSAEDYAEVLAAARADRNFSGDVEVHTRRGLRWHNIDARRGRDPLTGQDVIVITEEDVSERLRLAEERQALNRRLEERVRLRTDELERNGERLRQEMKLSEAMRREAEAATRAKSAFLAKMSHELRTPLNAIIGFSEMIRGERHGDLGQRYREYIADIHDSALGLLSLINDLLDLSRIEAGGLVLRDQEFDIAGVVRDAVEMIQAGEQGKALRIAVKLPSLPPLNADARAFRQVLLNLLSNSVKATRGGGEIEITAGAGVDGLVVTVTDGGCGIAEKDLDAVLAPYRQAVDVSDKPTEGAGLGLAIAKGLMDAQDGFLEIRSRLGEGTSVSLHYPAARLREGAPLATSS